jgi:hypothetical protein
MSNSTTDSKPKYFWTRFFSWLSTWRFWRWALLSLAVLITLLALAGLEETWRGKRAFDKFIAERVAKGDFIGPKYLNEPPIPDDKNFGMCPIWKPLFATHWATNPITGMREQQFDSDAVTNVFLVSDLENNASKPSSVTGYWRNGTAIDLSQWQSYYRATNDHGTCDFPVAPQPQIPAEDVLLALSRFDTNLALLRKYSAERPLCRYPVRYEYGPDVLLPHLSKLKSVASYLALRCEAELAIGKTNEAFEDLRLLMRVTDTLQNEPLLITHLVYDAMIAVEMQPLWEGLAAHKWSEEQLAILQKDLESHNLLASYKKAMYGERTFSYVAFEQLRTGHFLSEAQLIDSSYRRPAQVMMFFRPLLGGFFYQNELACLRPISEWTDNVTLIPSHRGLSTFDRVGSVTPYNMLARMLLPALARSNQKAAVAQGAIDLARTACALERYRIAHGAYPSGLAALAPQYVNEIPKDFLNGEPLKYRKVDDGNFVLYSVGLNMSDDGGKLGEKRTRSGKVKPSLDWTEGDWVWTYKKLADLPD